MIGWYAPTCRAISWAWAISRNGSLPGSATPDRPGLDHRHHRERLRLGVPVARLAGEPQRLLGASFSRGPPSWQA